MVNSQVRNVSTFQTPIAAVYNQRPVRILAIGDQDGHSPVYFITNELGQGQWLAVSDCRIADSHALPTSMEAFKTLTTRDGK